MKRIQFIGEQPSKPGTIAFDPYGDTTKRLAKLIGMDAVYMRHTFEFANLMPWGKWDAREARRRAQAWYFDDLTEAVVLLGRRVADAFGYSGSFRLFKDTFGPFRMQSLRVLLLPHPSGVNRWYNSFENREHARTLLRRLKRWAS